MSHPRIKLTLIIFVALATSLFATRSAGADDRDAELKQKLEKLLKRFPKADADGDGVLTRKEAAEYRRKVQSGEAKRERGNRANRKAVAPTHADVKYGPHERNVLDLWLVKSEKPTPLLICIHGGGFRGGDKKSFHGRSDLINAMHAAGASVAAINYRLTEGGKHPYPAAMHDGARAVQFLRSQADRYNLDKTRFGATGGSAGACILMWLGFHDDLADADNPDPVLRESSRLQALAPVNGPTSLHLPTIEKWFEVDSLVLHPALRPFYALSEESELDWDGKLGKLALDASPITHLTKDDDAPCFMTYGADRKVKETSNPGLWVHHPRMGLKLKEQMDRLGIECRVEYRGGPEIDGYDGQTDFLIQKLTRRGADK